MKNRLLVSALVASSVCFVLPECSEAQGMGGFIRKLSGPQMLSGSFDWDFCRGKGDGLGEKSKLGPGANAELEKPGAAFFTKRGCRESKWTYRYGVELGLSLSDEPAGNVYMYVFENSVIWRPWVEDDDKKWKRRTTFNVGLADLHFFGDDFASFSRLAPSVGFRREFHYWHCVSNCFSVGIKVELFKDSFNDQDFGGSPTFESGWEPVIGGYIGWYF